MTEQEQKKGRTERQLREGLGRVLAFIRSAEINTSLSSISLDDLLADAIVLIDDGQVPDGVSASSVDATARSLFVVDEGSRVVRRRGRLQRLAALAGDVLSKDQYDQLGFSSPYDQSRDERIVDEKSLFDRLRDAEYLKSLEDGDGPEVGRDIESKLVKVIQRFQVGGRVIEREMWFPEELLTPQQRSSGGTIIIDETELK